MNKKELINECIKNYEQLIKKEDKLIDVIGQEGTCLIFNNVFVMLDSYIDVVARLISDKGDWLNYYIFDCGCGKQPKNVYLNGVDETVLDSVDKLIYLIENY